MRLRLIMPAEISAISMIIQRQDDRYSEYTTTARLPMVKASIVSRKPILEGIHSSTAVTVSFAAL